MDKYTVMGVLGKGGFGEVFKAQDMTTGNMYAIKKCVAPENEKGIPETVLREVAILNALDSKYIVMMREFIPVKESDEPRYYNLVFELLDCNLHEYRVSKFGIAQGMGLDVAKRLLYQILLAAHECHQNGVMHRDLKPENILIEEETETAKLADFGLSRLFRLPASEHEHIVGSPLYMAPEVLLRTKHYTPAIDIWGVGCIFAEILQGAQLFGAPDTETLLRDIFQKLGTPTHLEIPEIEQRGGWKAFPRCASTLPYKFSDTEVLDMLTAMLEIDPEKRITAIDALRKPFFDDIRQDYPIDVVNRNSCSS